MMVRMNMSLMTDIFVTVMIFFYKIFDTIFTINIILVALICIIIIMNIMNIIIISNNIRIIIITIETLDNNVVGAVIVIKVCYYCYYWGRVPSWLSFLILWQSSLSFIIVISTAIINIKIVLIIISMNVNRHEDVNSLKLWW